MRRAAGALLLAGALLVGRPAPAQISEAEEGAPASPAQPRTSATEIEAGFSYENLSAGYSNWNSQYLEGVHHFGPRHTLYGLVRETDRFDLHDSQVAAGLYYPVAEHWTALIEGSYAPQHQVLPLYSVFGQLHRALPEGWGVALGYRHSEYNTTNPSAIVFDLERYFGNFRGAYTLYVGMLPGAPTVTASRFLLTYYYGERSSVGASFTFGEEVANVGPPLGVTITAVKNFSLFGRHWFAPDWAVSYEFVAQEQGSLYRYNGIRLGLRYRF